MRRKIISIDKKVKLLYINRINTTNDSLYGIVPYWKNTEIFFQESGARKTKEFLYIEHHFPLGVIRLFHLFFPIQHFLPSLHHHITLG